MSQASGQWLPASLPDTPVSGSSYTTPFLRGPSPPPSGRMPARVLNSKHSQQRVELERLNLRGRRRLYIFSDAYTTLVNCSAARFALLFLIFYFAMFASFAGIYHSQPAHCISNTKTYWHALWFSVHSSATIGYGGQSPDPDCTLTQLAIMAQVLISLFMQASLLGLIFARISSSNRSATIRFSNVLSMCCGEDGVGRLVFRVANLRQHQVIQPEVRMLLLRRQLSHPFSSGTAWEYIYSELAAEHVGGGRVWLGVPSLIEHRIDQQSPLWGMSDADMMAADLEIIVLLSGIDESTSRTIEARHSYIPADIRWHHRFDPCIHRRRSGKLGVDFSRFDSTALTPRGSHGSLSALNSLGAASKETSAHSRLGTGSFAAAAAAVVAQQQAAAQQAQQP